jgi:hypothetical protein
MLKSTQTQPPCAIRAGANCEVCYAHIMRGLATVALVAVVGSALSAQTLRDRVREFGREHPNAAYRFPRAPVDFAGLQTIEGIARNADVVVQCKLTKGDTRLSLTRSSSRTTPSLNRCFSSAVSLRSRPPNLVHRQRQ